MPDRPLSTVGDMTLREGELCATRWEGKGEGVRGLIADMVLTCVWLVSVGDLPAIDASDGFSPSVTALTEGAGGERH